MSYTKVFTDNAILVNRLKSLLTQENISCIVKDLEESGRLAGFGTINNSAELHVLTTDMPKAQAIISDFEKEISE